jgi:hypothetical protein
MNLTTLAECEARYVLQGDGANAETISSRKAIAASDGVAFAVRDVLHELLGKIRPDADRFAGLNARFHGDIELAVPHYAADTSFYLEPGMMIELSSLNVGLSVSVFLDESVPREEVQR